MGIDLDDIDIVVFGGTFDPPHWGHLNCVELALLKLPKAEVWVMPSPSPAGASGKHKSPFLSYKERFNLVQLAFMPLSRNKRLKISDLESEIEPPNYTQKTLLAIKDSYPDKKVALLMGEDQFLSFSKWYKAADILSENFLVVIKRDGFSKEAKFKEELIKLASDLGISEEKVSSQIYFIEDTIHEAASRVIRKNMAEDAGGTDNWIPENVLKYIKENKLYKEKGY